MSWHKKVGVLVTKVLTFDISLYMNTLNADAIIFFFIETRNTKPVQVGTERKKKRNVLREKLPLTDVLLPLMNKVAFQCHNNVRNTK